MKHRKVSIGILGAGKMAYWHLRAYRFNPHVKVLAICNPRSKRGLELAKKFKIPDNFCEAEKILSLPGLDAIDICAPTGLHKELICAAIKKGLDVYTEKPMCCSLKEADEIVELNKVCKKKIFVGFNLRFCKEYIAIKDILDSGELGDARFIFFMRGNIVNPGSHIFDPTLFSGIITEFGSHFLDLLRWWGHTDVQAVYSQGTNIFSNYPRPDTVSLNIKFKDGLSAGIINTYAMPNLSPEILILGSKKMLRLKYGKVLVQKLPGRWSIPSLLWITLKESMILPYRILYNPLKNACGYFVECIRDNKPPIVDEIEGRENVRLAELLNESYRQERALTF